MHHGRVVKRTGDGAIVEFRSVVDAVNCAIEIQRAMVERNAEVAPDKRIEFRGPQGRRPVGQAEAVAISMRSAVVAVVITPPPSDNVIELRRAGA